MHAAPRRINRAVSGILVPSEDSGGFSGGVRRGHTAGVSRHCLSQHACRSGACAVDELHTIISILHIDLQPFLVLNSELCAYRAASWHKPKAEAAHLSGAHRSRVS